MTSEGSRRRWFWRIAVVGAVVLLLSAAAGSFTFYQLFLRDLPDPHSVADYQPSLATQVFDRNGEPIGEFFRERRRLVLLEDVPDHVVEAFIAAEDSNFYQHEGIDFQGVVRAAWRNFIGGEIKEGASTITQQVVKGLLLSPERTYTRKIREMILARRIEQRFSKEEILYLYLNQIYFGNGAYGISEAARSYFGKEVRELDLSEGAQLAGLPKAPSRYSPFYNPDQAEQRRRYVLQRMLEDGRIDAETHAETLAALPEFVDGSKPPAFEAAAYFTEEVRRFLVEQLGDDAVLQGGLRVETSLDLPLQQEAVAAVRGGLEALDRRNGYRGPLRQVVAGDIPEEIERIAEENGEEALSLPFAQPLVGVVTSVDEEDQLARVALGGGLLGEVRLEDVSWARPLDPDTRPREIKKIEKVFAVGDVARFQAQPSDPEAEATAEDEPVSEEIAAADPDVADALPAGPLRLHLYQQPKVQGALLSLDVKTGEVLALVGGYDFAASEFNRVTQALRQPGSAFKPLIYGAALSVQAEDDAPLYTPASIVHDRPKVYRDHRSGFVWKPKNYGRSFYGPITLRTALAKSVNNASVHLADEVGVGAVLEYAKRLGIESPLERSLGLALGTSGVHLLEITRAYAVFPNGGRRVVPIFVRRVLSRDGELLYERVPLGDTSGQSAARVAPLEEEVDAPEEAAVAEELPEADIALEDPAPPDGEEGGDPDQLIPPEQAYLMVDMLRAVVNEGTGVRARKLGAALAGKTGTTNDQADAWFVGFSPSVATGVWVGFDEIRFLGAGETGSRAALPIWIDYMRSALRAHPRDDFSVPGHNRIVFARIDRDTGLLATRGTQETVFQPFIAGSEPRRTADSAIRSDRARHDLREDSFGDFDADPAQQLDFDAF